MANDDVIETKSKSKWFWLAVPTGEEGGEATPAE